MNYSTQNIIHWIGKLLILGVIVYFGVLGVTNPAMFARMVPAWVSFAPAATLVIIHGIIMIASALFVLFGRGGRLLYVILILCVIAVVISVSGMTFVRDLAILGGTLVLFANAYRK